MSASATYLYAITRPVPADALGEVRGMSGGAVRVLRDGELACLVSTVALDEFGEQTLPAHLENLAWLEQAARAHDAVVQAAARVVTTAPLRMATICRDDESALARLRELGDRAEGVLRRLDGRIEWGVKMFAATTSPDPSDAPASSGTDYLRRRRDQARRTQEASLRAAERAESAFATLSGLAVAARRHRPQDPQLSGTDEQMLLNAAFLVDDERAEKFRSDAQRLAQTSAPARLVLTGPWPPYSFATVDEP